MSHDTRPHEDEIQVLGRHVEGNPDEDEQEPEDPWQKKNLLCFDGGGVRGLWSLYVLEKLMQLIGRRESEYIHQQCHDRDDTTCSSFHPYSYPSAVSQAEPEGEEWDNKNRCCRLSPQRRFLPCHYFDHISGSSTGALIAIMLGRLRMPVSDCIMEYELLGGRVFGNPRKLHAMNVPFLSRPKYNTSNFEEIIKSLVERRLETEMRHEFKSDKDLCRTMVTTYKKGTADSELFLFRSYNHIKPLNAKSSHAATTTSLPGPKRRPTEMTSQARENRGNQRSINYGRASTHSIWQVARVASAPPLFFHPMMLQISSGKFAFEDGGLGIHNNPTREAILDVVDHGQWDSVGKVVSIGSARKFVPRGSTITATVRRMSDRLADPETIEGIVRQMNSAEHPFYYQRFNAEAKGRYALSTIFDEWKPRSGRLVGRATVEYMRASFNSWVTDEKNRQALEECAQQLVEIRRKRAEITPAKWERFVTCHSFTCRQSECLSANRDEVFQYGNEFEDHLITEHRFHRGSPELLEEMKACREKWGYPDREQTHGPRSGT